MQRTKPRSSRASPRAKRIWRHGSSPSGGSGSSSPLIFVASALTLRRALRDHETNLREPRERSGAPERSPKEGRHEALEAMRFSMGLEVECKVRHEGRTSSGRARLEATDLTFRGDFRLTIPLGRITSLEADGGELAVEFDGGEAIFELGAAAEKWARAIKKPKSRLDKLGVKPGLVVSVIGVEERSFIAELKRRNIELSVG